MTRNDRTPSFVERIYPNQIPAFAEQALDQLYGSLYASLPQLQLSALAGVHTYAAWQDEALRSLFLYTLEGRELRVLNEGMCIDQATTSGFANRMFALYPQVARVHFRAVQLPAGRSTDPQPWSLPSARFTLSEDMVITLPDSEQAYLSSLGKSTRKSLRLGMARAPGLSHRVIRGDQVDTALVETIVRFNHARMQRKQRRSALDERATTQLLTLLRARGHVGLVSLQGRLCAGTLACRFADDMYSLVNAHDPAFDALGMGRISRHLMIVAAIRSGVQRFHLLGGHLAGKQAALAQRVPLEDLLLYRSPLARASDVPALLRLQLAATTHELRTALEDQELARSAAWPSRIALSSLRVLQAWRRAARKRTSSLSAGPARPELQSD